MNNRTLRLRQESLADLTPDELDAVAGGHSIPTCFVATSACDTMVTFTKIPSGCNCTGGYPTINLPCDTIGAIDIKTTG